MTIGPAVILKELSNRKNAVGVRVIFKQQIGCILFGKDFFPPVRNRYTSPGTAIEYQKDQQ